MFSTQSSDLNRIQSTYLATRTVSTLQTTSEHGVSSITTAAAHTSAASSRLNWRSPCRFKWTRPFRRKTKSGFCACAITFQTQSTHFTGGWLGPRAGLDIFDWATVWSRNGIGNLLQPAWLTGTFEKFGALAYEQSGPEVIFFFLNYTIK